MTLPKGISLSARRMPDGSWRADLNFKVTDGGVGFRLSGTDEAIPEPDKGPGAAIHRAVALANIVTSNPAMANMMPPGTVATMQAVKSLARAAKRGVLGHKINGKPIWAHFSGALKKLAKHLHDAEQGVNNASTLVQGFELCGYGDGVFPPRYRFPEAREQKQLRGPRR